MNPGMKHNQLTAAGQMVNLDSLIYKSDFDEVRASPDMNLTACNDAKAFFIFCFIDRT